MLLKKITLMTSIVIALILTSSPSFAGIVVSKNQVDITLAPTCSHVPIYIPYTTSNEFYDESLITVSSDSNWADATVLSQSNQIEITFDTKNLIASYTATISINDVVKQLHKTIMDDDQNYYTIPDSAQQINNLFFLYEMNEESDISSLINYDANQGIITALMKTFSTAVL